MAKKTHHTLLFSIVLLGCAVGVLAGRCDRPWLPYLDTSQHNYGASSPKIVDLLTLARTTDRNGVKDMVQSRLQMSSDPTLQNLEIPKSNMQVQGTFAGVAISIRLDKSCDSLLKEQPGWHVDER